MGILIRGGRIVDAATDTDKTGDIYLEDGIIAEIGQKLKKKDGDRVIDAKGKLVMPGIIDLHVHFRDPGQTHKEDIKSGAAAAARGGVTTVVAMPNTTPTIDNPDRVNYVHNKAAQVSGIHVLQAGAATMGEKGTELADIAGMVKAGIPAVSEDGKSVMNAVEDTITARDIILALETGVHLHLCHCSTYGDAQMMKIVKEKGYDNITAEVCPHHFILSSDDIKTDDPNYKMNPPLRTPKDVEALKQGLKDGTIEVISTDHAPHSAQEKTGSMKNAPFGIVGLETSLPLTYTELVEKDVITLKQMVEKMCLNPAKILGLDRGTLQKGHPADVIIVDTEQEYAIDKNKFVSKGHNTPFDGWKVKGKVLYTICDGKIVFKNQEEKES